MTTSRADQHSDIILILTYSIYEWERTALRHLPWRWQMKTTCLMMKMPA